MAPNDTLPEVLTREEIDKKLGLAGWVVQDKKRINLFESLGVAVREMDTDTGPVDYMLFIDGKACGILEAKRDGTDLGGVAERSARYASSNTKQIERCLPANDPLPFLYEATNHEVWFLNKCNTTPHSQKLFRLHKHEKLQEWLRVTNYCSRPGNSYGSTTQKTYTTNNYCK